MRELWQKVDTWQNLVTKLFIDTIDFIQVQTAMPVSMLQEVQDQLEMKIVDFLILIRHQGQRVMADIVQ